MTHTCPALSRITEETLVAGPRPRERQC